MAENIDPIAEALKGLNEPQGEPVDPIKEALAPLTPKDDQSGVPQDTPGFWGDITQAAVSGSTEATQRLSEFSQGMQRKAQGGSFFPTQEQIAQSESDFRPQIVSPETDAEVKRLQQQGISQGWSNPKWLAVHAIGGLAGSYPELGAGAVGSLAGPVGSVAAFAGASGALSLIPNFKAAKARNPRMSDDEAIQQAIIDSGIDTATAAAMGIIPSTPVVRNQVRKIASGPVREALVHMGVVLPAIGEAGAEAKSVVDEGKLRGPDEIMTDWVNNFGTNMLLGAGHAALGRIGEAGRPATEEGIRTAYEGATTHTMPFLPPVMPELEMRAQTLKPPQLDDLGFYSRVREVVDNGPSAASAEQWRGVIQNARGVKEEEVRFLRLPEYLADAQGKVSREDLMEHIDSNALRLEERQLEIPRAPVPANIRDIMMRASPRMGTEPAGIPSDSYIRSLQANYGAAWHEHFPPGYVRNAMRDGRLRQEDLTAFEAWRNRSDEAKYAGFTLPGEKSNYREVLLKIPVQRGDADVTMRKKEYQTLLSQYANDPNYTHNPALDGGPFIHRRSRLPPMDLESARVAYNQAVRNANLRGRETQFTEGHFDPNTLAHFRITDRKDRDGKRVRFIEEIQSDWHQKGRKSGYKGEPISSGDRDWMEAFDSRIERMVREHEARARAGLTNSMAERAYQDLRWTMLVDARDGVQRLRDRGIVGDEEARRYVELLDRERASHSGVPDAPFKKNWQELVFKRILRQAADEGMERVAWTTGDQQIRRYGADEAFGLNPEQQAGMHEFYDKMLPSLAKKYAKQLGTEVGETRLYDKRLESGSLDYPERMQQRDLAQGRGPFGRDAEATYFDTFPEHQMIKYIELNEAMKSKVSMGFPLFMKKAGVEVDAPSRSVFRQTNDAADKLIPEAKRAVMALEGLRRSMGVDVPITVHLAKGRPEPGLITRDQNGYHIYIDLTQHRAITEIYATLAHEFGHLLSQEYLEKSPWTAHQQLRQAYEKWRQENVRPSQKMLKLLESRDNAIHEYYGTKSSGVTEQTDFQLGSLSPEQQRYWSGFEEWFAEQVAKWATTDVKPLNAAERFFKGLGEALQKIRLWLVKATGKEYLPDRFVSDWLNSFMDRGPPPFAAGSFALRRLRSQQASQRALDRDGSPEVRAVEVTPVTMQSRTLVAEATKGGEPPEAAADAAHADRLGKIHEWLLSLPQIAEQNPNIVPLQKYRDGLGGFNTKIRQDHEAPLEILHAWQKLHGPAGDAVASLIDDWANMRYLSQDEIKNEVKRMPTKDEFAKLVKDNKVSDQGLAVFNKVVAHVDSKLSEVARILKRRGEGITDAKKKADYMKAIDDSVAEERKAPYFPFFHDGEYTVEVKGAVGETLYYGRTRTKKDQTRLAAQLSKSLGPGEEVKQGFLAKDARPLAGIPGAMLDAIADNLSLSESQKYALEKLRVEQKPQIAMIRRVRPKVKSPGYSSDFIRSYAQYAHHTARYFARVDWSPLFRQWIRDVREIQGGPRLDSIANYMQKHYAYIMDPTADFAALRGLIFNLRLGFSPTTATLYLTQTPLGTLPWLGRNFGDIKALAALAKASTQRYNYYKSGKLLATTEPQLRAQREAMRNYVLDGGVAPELAGIAENANLTSNTLRGTLARGWNNYQQASGTLLHLADTWNRRIAFDAAWHAAMDQPNASYLKEAIRAFPLEYARLQASGWTPQEAAAYVAGKHTVEATHFVYQRSHRPQVMWGKSSALLMFQFWKQNMLFTLWNYPGVRGRSLLVMAAMGGLMGLPAAKDLHGLIQAIGWQLFGKDWNLEREMREYVLEHFGKDREWLADSLLHGGERRGMGIPTVLDLLGHHVGLPKLPEVDRSAAVGLGDVLPVNMGELLGPTRDIRGAELKAAQDIAGAAFGAPFDLFKALTDQNLSWSDFKRWEPVIPHWMSNASKAYRWYSEGMERDRQGNPIVRFDANNPTQAAEILARGLGYTPTRLSLQYDARSAKMEIEAYWRLRHELLMRQAWDARRVNDMDQYKRVQGAIQSFNASLPAEVRPLVTITGEKLLQFMQNQAKKSAMAQQGLPPQRNEIPLSAKVKQMYGLEPRDEQQIKVR